MLGRTVRRAVLCTVLVLLTAVGVVAPATAASRTSGLFADDDGDVHEASIEALAVAGITRGCGLGRFCPDDPVTRGQMAAFIDRSVPLAGTATDWFVDDDDSIFEGSIDRLRAAAVTRGCNPPANDRFCPRDPITRGQLAVFLTTALGLSPSDRDWFVDDDASPFEASIQALRRAGVTKGCNPPANDRFCPDDPVTRGQMATFLARVLELRQPWPLDGSSCPSGGLPCAASDRTHPVAFSWDGIELRLPSSASELVGWHESNNDGARDLHDHGVVDSVVMASRGRGTGRRSAADVVVHPRVEIRSPVTGTVVRSGTYALYCRYSDDFLVVEPDGRPGIEVKLVHIDGVRVGPGDRVVAGVTVVAGGPTPLPFESQVDDHSGGADHPHVHLELVDTSIPDRPGGGC